ncbi:MAG: lipid-A-disaccharide synthase [bacterium]
MNLLLVAGELSGDAHGGAIMGHLRELLPGLRMVGVGGPRMSEAGLKPLFPITRLQARGLVEVVRDIPRHFRYLRRLAAHLDRERPDALLLIDYPGFNLRLAKQAKLRGIPVLYFSGPQLWAWRGGRMKEIARWVDRIVVLFPFEVELYRRAGVDAEFLGHPLVGVEATAEQVESLRATLGGKPGHPVVAVMPGSRPNELQRHLPDLLETIRLIDAAGYDATFVLPLAQTLDRRLVEEQVEQSGVALHVVDGAFLPLLKLADSAIVASGTATLQVAMAGVPFLVVYRVAPPTYWFARLFAYVKYVSIVNILAGREIAPELLQGDFNPKRVADAFLQIARDDARRKTMRKELAEVTAGLGEPGAYRRAAQSYAGFLKNLSGAAEAAAGSA